MLAEVLAAAPASIDAADLRARGFTKIDLGQGTLPHADGRVRARRPASSSCAADALAEARASTRCRTTTRPPRSPTRELAARLPAGAADAEDAPVPQLDVRERRPPARGAARAPASYLNPADAAARGIADGRPVRVANDRGAFQCRAIVSDEARPGVRWRRWAGGIATTPAAFQPAGRDAAATHPLGEAPTFNDCRVEVARV